MLLLEGYISNFPCARYDFRYVEFSGFYFNQSLAGQTLSIIMIGVFKKHFVARTGLGQDQLARSAMKEASATKCLPYKRDIIHFFLLCTF
jgi:hypothetical protein